MASLANEFHLVMTELFLDAGYQPPSAAYTKSLYRASKGDPSVAMDYHEFKKMEARARPATRRRVTKRRTVKRRTSARKPTTRRRRRR